MMLILAFFSGVSFTLALGLSSTKPGDKDNPVATLLMLGALACAFGALYLWERAA